MEIIPAIGKIEGACGSGQGAISSGGVVNGSKTGGSNVFVPEEFVLLPEGEEISAAPDCERFFLVLDEVTVDHRIEIVACAVIGDEGEVR